MLLEQRIKIVFDCSKIRTGGVIAERVKDLGFHFWLVWLVVLGLKTKKKRSLLWLRFPVHVIITQFLTKITFIAILRGL